MVALSAKRHSNNKCGNDAWAAWAPLKRRRSNKIKKNQGWASIKSWFDLIWLARRKKLAWFDLIWAPKKMAWFDLIWAPKIFGLIWFDLIWVPTKIGLIWFDLIWAPKKMGLIWFDLIGAAGRSDLIWFFGGNQIKSELQKKSQNPNLIWRYICE